MQGVHLRKYGVQATIDFELYEVDGVDLRVDWVPAAADCEIMKDGGASTQCTNTAVDEGSTYSIVLTATEMQAARLVLKVVDAATKVFLDKVIIIETYGNASAQHAADLDDGVRLGLTALPNAAADAAGGLAVSDAGGLDLDAIKTETDKIALADAGAGVAGSLVEEIENRPTLTEIQQADISAETDPDLLGGAINEIKDGGVLDSGTARVADITDAPNQIQLAAGAPTTLEIGCLVFPTGGTGTGQNPRVFLGWADQTNRVAKIAPTWATDPDATTTYKVLIAGNPAASVASASMQYAAVTTGTSATSFAATGLPTSADDAFHIDANEGQVVKFITGALKGQARRITDYVGASDTLTTQAFTGTPAVGDVFIVL